MLVASLLLLGCGDDATEGSALRINIDYDQSWPITAFDIFVDGTREVVAPADEVVVAVPDGSSGVVEISVHAVANQSEWASGQAQVSLLPGQETSVAIALLQASCTDASDCLAPDDVCSAEGSVRGYPQASCISGGCVYDFEDSACDSPPVDECVGDSVRSYTETGSCDDGTCVFDFTDTLCDGGCIDGACDTTCSAEACQSPTEVAFDQPWLRRLILTDTELHWNGNHIVRSRPKSGGAVLTRISYTQTSLYSFALDDSDLYVSATSGGGRISRQPLSTTQTNQNVETFWNDETPLALTAGLSHVYAGSNGGLYRVAKATGEAERYWGTSSQDRIADLAIEGPDIYWVRDERLYRSATADPSEAFELRYTASQNITDIAVDANHIYWTTPGNGLILRQHRLSGIVETVASEQDGASEIDLTESHVYWGVAAGLRRRAKSGGAIEEIAQTAPYQDSVFAVDDANIYWSTAADPEGSGSIVRLPLCCFAQ